MVSTPLCVHAAERAPRQPIRIAVHVHSTVSDGEWMPQRLVQEADEIGLDGILFADTLLERWEYGLWPLRRIVRRVFERNSVLTWGSANYVRHLRELAVQFPDMLVLPAVTVAPYYHWTNIPLFRKGELQHWHRQLVVWGLSPQAITALPVTSSTYAAWWRVLQTPWRLWPLCIVLMAAMGWRRHPARRWLWMSGLCVGVILLWNVDMRRTSHETPYGRDAGVRPYQTFIDYVRAHGGTVMWAHPAMDSSQQFMTIPVRTPPYLHLLEETTGYAGFGMNFIAQITPVLAGHEWDALLQRYTRHERAAPPWLIGEVGWHQPTRRVDMVTTVVYAEERTEESVLAALAQGHSYAQFNTSHGVGITIASYTVEDSATQRSASMGDTLTVQGPVQIMLTGVRAPIDHPIRITIIRNGEPVYTTETLAPDFQVVWADTDAPQMQSWYYRVVLQQGTVYAITNPTFVARK
jgi:hypothetical protein